MLVEVVSEVGVVGPGELFARAKGYAVANREGVKVLDLREHPDWAPLERKVAERLGDHRIVEWGTFTPDEYAQAVCDALNVFVGMVPMGDLALEDTSFTPERLRRNETRSDAIGRRRVTAAAFAADGTLAALQRHLHPGPRGSLRPASASRWCCPSTVVMRSGWP